MEKYSKRSKIKRASFKRKTSMTNFSVFNEIIAKYAQDTSTNVIPEETQIGQSVYDESDAEFVIIEDDINTTNKVVMPKDQMGVGVPQGVKTVEDTDLSSQYTVQPSSGQVISSKSKRKVLPSFKASKGTKISQKHSNDKGRAAMGILNAFSKSYKGGVLPEFRKQAQGDYENVGIPVTIQFEGYIDPNTRTEWTEDYFVDVIYSPTSKDFNIEYIEQPDGDQLSDARIKTIREILENNKEYVLEQIYENLE